ncbi:unnamed protein product [Euphydryas editha]|uniref:Ig-like domain-containing protein n=1 Tax=Euphydryas editha TaxID=104508 RepID=A0AAU9TMN1_EUPED|nr:unnamed protein product [Euphydryas editha]
MEDEIYAFKVNIASIVNVIRSSEFANYILIPFGDEDVGPPLVFATPEELVDIMQIIETIGGQGCPENSLAAIERALQVSMPKSYIYVFTDAEAKSITKLDNIKNLCQTRRSKVIIFKSGECQRVDLNQFENENIYYEVARNCGGSVFNLKLSNIRDVFKYIKEITKVDWNDVNTHEEFRTKKQYILTIDTYTKDLVVTVSGKYPTIQFKNNFGDSPHIEKIVETQSMLVIRVQVTELGDFTTDVSCQGTGLVTIYRKKELNFQYGFSPLEPKSLKETASRPIPGVMNYVMISLPVDSTTKLIAVNIQTSDKYEEKTVTYREVDKSRGLYVVQTYVTPGIYFKITITCRDTTTYQEITGTTASILPQQTSISSQKSKPKIEIIESESLIDFGTSYKVACKVFGYPKPNIWWENDFGETVPSQSALLEIPSIYISYVTIANATRNGTITCKCKNDEGEAVVSMDLYVNRTFVFEVIKYPTDITIEYGNEGRLYCDVNAYPDAEIEWYHNETAIETSENIEWVPYEHMLLIKNMGIDDTGEYKCTINNTIETRTYMANVYISGLEEPKAETQNLEVVLKPGDWTEQQCTSIKGVPTPEVSWKYKSYNGKFVDFPEGVFVNGSSLKIASAVTEHGGIYVCEAVNILGTDAQEITVKVQYAPKIKNDDENKTVREGDFVELPCDVDAVPKANVLWDMYQDDVIIALDEHHKIDDRHTHRFYARYNDSGMYHCIAQNDMGRAIRTVTLNVLVAPYIEPLPWTTLTVRSNSTVVLTCNVSFGNPAPSTKWQYVANNLDTAVLLRGHSTGKLDLVLRNVTKRQEGTYQCVAENEVGPDTVKVYLKVL